MPSNTAAAAANLSPRIVRGGKRGRATLAAKAKTAPATKAKLSAYGKKPAKQPQKPQELQESQESPKPATIAAEGELAAVVTSAKSAPVTLTIKGKPAAVVMSARLYRQLGKALHELLERDEDLWCIEQVHKYEKEGFVGPAESAAFMREMRDALDN